MSEERRGASGPGATGEVKVVDRRRFRSDGEPADGAASADPPAAMEAPSGDEAPGDDRDARLAAQDARIDEITRAYAALIEENKGYRQRSERERARVIEAERAGVAQALLDAADDLERALSAVANAADAQGDAFRNLADGVRLSLGGLHKRIAELGAERISVMGQPFDPHVAEAVDTVAVADAEQDGMVVQEVQSGYRIGDRVLRPARVRVGRLARA